MNDTYVPTDADAPDDDGYGGRVPPHDLLAEQSVLGGMMLAELVRDRDVIDDVVDRLVPADFYMPKHEVIAKAIVTLHREQKPTDVIAVSDELTSTGMLSRAGGAGYLHELTAAVPSAANAGYYADVVAKKAVMRRLVAAGMRIVDMGYASEGEPEELVGHARAELEQAESRPRVIVQRVDETLDTVIDGLAKAPSYIPSPWESLNSLTGGFAPGELTVVAARPGGGKSIALLQIATKFAKRGAVAFSSLEMTEEQLQIRLLAQYGGIEMSTLRNHTLSEIDWNNARDAREALHEAPLFIDDTPGVTIPHIRSFARAVQRRHGNLGAICVDYLQLIRGEGRERQEVVANAAEALKNLAKEFHVPVVAAAQLRRAPVFRGKPKPPGMDDLRESGGIENNADLVILQHRPDEKRDEIEQIVGKSRHGSQGRFKLRWQGHYARLLDKEFDPTAHLFPKEEAQ